MKRMTAVDTELEPARALQLVDWTQPIVPSNVRVGVHEMYGGGGILRFDLPGNRPLQIALQSELLFDFFDHVERAAATFENQVSQDVDDFNESREASREAFERELAATARGGWSFYIEPNQVRWIVRLDEAIEGTFRLSPMVIRQLYEQLDVVTNGGWLFDLRPFIGMSWQDMSRAFEQLPGHELYERQRAFDFSLALFRRHSKALIEHLQAASGSLSLEQLRWDRRFAIEQSIEEAAFRLFDYLAAAHALTDHCRVLYRELYEPNGAIPEYQGEIDKRFKTNGISTFFKHLRHLILHKGLLGPGHRVNLSKAVGTFTLNRCALLSLTSDANDWPAPARKLLEAATDDLDLLELVTANTKAIEDFHEWFQVQRDGVHWKERRHMELMRRAVLARRGLLDLPNIQSLANRTDVGVRQLREALAGFLAAQDVYELRDLESDTSVWMEAALGRAADRYYISGDFRRDLMAAAARGSTPRPSS